MNYNIEFQIASIIFITVLTIVFYSKKRWGSLANLIFRAIMIVTLIELELGQVKILFEILKEYLKLKLIKKILYKRVKRLKRGYFQ